MNVAKCFQARRAIDPGELELVRRCRDVSHGEFRFRLTNRETGKLSNDLFGPETEELGRPVHSVNELAGMMLVICKLDIY